MGLRHPVVNICVFLGHKVPCYGVAMTSRLLKIEGLFCKRAL